MSRAAPNGRPPGGLPQSSPHACIAPPPPPAFAPRLEAIPFLPPGSSSWAAVPQPGFEPSLAFLFLPPTSFHRTLPSNPPCYALSLPTYRFVRSPRGRSRPAACACKRPPCLPCPGPALTGTLWGLTAVAGGAAKGRQPGGEGKCCWAPHKMHARSACPDALPAGAPGFVNYRIPRIITTTTLPTPAQQPG